MINNMGLAGSDTSPFGRSAAQQRQDQQAATIFDGREALAAEIDGFDDLLGAVVNEQAAMSALVLSDGATHEAVRLLLAQAVNDFIDLVGDLSRGHGRSAMRAARALVEHGINAHTITSDLPAAQRYLDHLPQGRAVASELAAGADLLRGNEARKYRRRLDRLGSQARERFNQAVSLHGSWFRRSWTQDNLRDRADRFGLHDLYEYYRLGSLVAHGAAGGALGSTRDDGEFFTNRIGPALELAPIAFIAGLRGYREVLSALHTVRHDVAGYCAGLDGLELRWPDYYRAAAKIDDELWPDKPAQPPVAVFAFAKNRSSRWYLHLPHLGMLLPAREPTLPVCQAGRLQRIIDHTLEKQHHLFSPTHRFVTVSVDGVTVLPDEKRPFVPDTALLVTPPPSWQLGTLDLGSGEWTPLDDQST